MADTPRTLVETVTSQPTEESPGVTTHFANGYHSVSRATRHRDQTQRALKTRGIRATSHFSTSRTGIHRIFDESDERNRRSDLLRHYRGLECSGTRNRFAAEIASIFDSTPLQVHCHRDNKYGALMSRNTRAF